MKKIFFMAAAAIAVLSGCSSDNDIAPEKKTNVFSAKIESVAGTRATLNDNTPNWEIGDVISINGTNYTSTKTGPTSDFSTEGTGVTGDTYEAFFPATLSSKTLPAAINEAYGASKFNMPMYATSTTTNLTFKNLCGVLKITVDNTQVASVKSIRVSSSNKAISGAFTVENDAAVLTNTNAVANTLTITYTTAVSTTDAAKTFYVAIPAQIYRDLKIEIDPDGNGFTKSMTTKEGVNITVARNTIYPITFKAETFATWTKSMSLGRGTAKTINIKTNATDLPTEASSSAEQLDDYGKLWAVLDGTTLTIKTSESKIVASNNTNFTNYRYVTKINGLGKIDTSEMTDMNRMFSYCASLTSLDVSKFNTANVTDMSLMFYNNSSLTSLDLSKFNTTNVTNMSLMFYGNKLLTSLDVSHFNTANVTATISMFNGCSSLTSLDLSSFNTGSVTDMSNMFQSCEKLQSLTLSNNFTLTSATSKTQMFTMCGRIATGGCTIYGVTNETLKTALSACPGWTYMHFGGE